MARRPKLTYRDAGVDIDAGDALVSDIKSIARPTMRPEVLGGIGGFGSVTRIPEKYRRPLLVSGTDGVGTKLKLAIEARCYDGIGIDLVGMCVNDVLVSGAEPLFFLDYYAVGKLDPSVAAEVIRGIAEGCRQAGCALVGGETAEMPGLYAPGDFDLAGFTVGVVEESELIDGQATRAGDILIALPSSGPHANGYSLVRRVLEVSGASLDDAFEGTTLGNALLAPTAIYVRPILALLSGCKVHAMAHVTGGGLPGNLPRVLPEDCGAEVETASWTPPAIFGWLQEAGGIEDAEMRRTFNCGIGFVLAVAPESAEHAIAQLGQSGLSPWVLGRVVEGPGVVHYT